MRSRLGVISILNYRNDVGAGDKVVVLVSINELDTTPSGNEYLRTPIDTTVRWLQYRCY